MLSVMDSEDDEDVVGEGSKEGVDDLADLLSRDSGRRWVSAAIYTHKILYKIDEKRTLLIKLNIFIEKRGSRNLIR